MKRINLYTRQFEIDLIRALAVVGVVMIHLTFPIYSRPDFVGGTTWWIAQTINVFSRVSVPLFVMISGYLLLGKQENVSQSLKRTWNRLIIPLLFYSLLYHIWDAYLFHKEIDLHYAFQELISGGFGHLYFLVIMINLYLTLPLIRLFWKNARLRQKCLVTTLILGLFLIYSWIMYRFNLHSELDLGFFQGLPYLGYFLVGSLVSSIQWPPRAVVISGIIWLTSSMVTLMLGYYSLQTYSQGNMTLWGPKMHYYENYLSLNVVVAAISGFIFLKNLNYQAISEGIIRSMVVIMAVNAFGIYVLHLISINIVDSIFGLHIDSMTDNLTIYLFKRILLVFTLTLVLSQFVRKTPLLKKSLGE